MSRFTHDTVLKDYSPREEVSEGVVLERRVLLQFSVATLGAALFLPSCGLTSAGKRSEKSAMLKQSTPGVLEIGELLAEMFPLAKQVIDSGGSQEESYLMSVGALMARLRIPSNIELEAEMLDLYETHGTSTRESFEVDLRFYDIEPGKGFSHHDHRDYNGVVLGIEGEFRIRNYDFLQPDLAQASSESFKIRKVREDLILPGRFSSLGLRRENIHDIVAGNQGGLILDAFTIFKPDADSFFMEVDPKPCDPERNIFEAVWA